MRMSRICSMMAFLHRPRSSSLVFLVSPAAGLASEPWLGELCTLWKMACLQEEPGSKGDSSVDWWRPTLRKMLTRGLLLGVWGASSSGRAELHDRVSNSLRPPGSALPSREDSWDPGPVGDVSLSVSLKASSDGSVAERSRGSPSLAFLLRMVSKELDRDFLAFSLRWSKVKDGVRRSRKPSCL
uniref:Putative secreted protein n=1 Tax=Ixodes ricinus TaxID=34613 RepID=A0A6B0UZU3_IXORI